MGIYKNEFTDDIIEHVKERLEDYEGLSFYSSDLVSELTMYENMNGAWIIGTYRASEYIKDHWDETSDTFEYFKSELEMSPNPFSNPEAYTFYMLEYGVQMLCSYSDYLCENEELTLTETAIQTIVAELEQITDIKPF